MFSGPGFLMVIVTCLKSHETDLSANCKAVMKPAR